MSSPTSTPGSGRKPLSSKLLTMKFMQRAAASSPATSSPSTPDEPSPKRQKRNLDSPSKPSFDVNALANQRAVQAAVAEEDAKRQAALERQAAEAGDTRWVLSFEDKKDSAESEKLALQIVPTSYANLDLPSSSNSKSTKSDSEWEGKSVLVGRRSFGKFNRVLEKLQDPSTEDSSDSDSEEDDNEESTDDSDSDNPANDLIKAARQEAAQRAKAERKAKKLAETAESQELAKKRKNKEVNLNGLKSLSGRKGTQGVFKGACYKCGGPHPKSECPQNQRGYQGADGSHPIKAFK